jgi:hypothetical protein
VLNAIELSVVTMLEDEFHPIFSCDNKPGGKVYEFLMHK